MRHSITVIALTGLFAACASSGVMTRPQDIPALERRAAALPADAAAATALGMAYFNAGRHEDAKNTLTRVVANAGVAGAARERMRGRLALVAREQLRAEAKQVLDREQQMSQEAPTARTVGCPTASPRSISSS